LFFSPLRAGKKSILEAVEHVFFTHTPDGVYEHGEDFSLLKTAAERHGFKVPSP
jgi:hypothetical protein